MQKGTVYRNDIEIGVISKENNIYKFKYNRKYIDDPRSVSISVNLPLEEENFESAELFSFFANMLAEGNIKDIQCRDLRIDKTDHFTRLLKTTENNTIGSITVREIEDKQPQTLGSGLGELLAEIEDAYDNEIGDKE